MTRDRGSVTAFVVGITLSMMLLVGLVHDGGRLVSAHLRVGDHAAGAARSGAQELTGLRAGAEVLDVVGATRRAHEYLMARGATGEVSVTPSAITVTVHTRVTMEILSVVGVVARDVSASRTAVAVRR